MATVLPPSLADFCGVVSESKRIISAHSRHFLALSVLFLLPLSFSLSVFPILFHSFPSSSVSARALLRLSTSSSFPPPHQLHLRRLHLSLETLTLLLLLSSFVLLLSLSAAASLTYSVFHGFYGRPVKLASALSSLSRSFLPLLATFSAALLSFSSVFAAYALYELLAWKGFEVIAGSPDSLWFLAISSVGALISALALAGLATNWILVSAVVVTESRWGFDALLRSQKLVAGMKRTGLSLISFYGITAALLLWIGWIASSDEVRDWAFVMQIVLTSAILTLILLYGIASNTVFYMYCKAVSGELADEIAKEFATEYVSLPFDDDKLPHLVSLINH